MQQCTFTFLAGNEVTVRAADRQELFTAPFRSLLSGSFTNLQPPWYTAKPGLQLEGCRLLPQQPAALLQPSSSAQPAQTLAPAAIVLAQQGLQGPASMLSNAQAEVHSITEAVQPNRTAEAAALDSAPPEPGEIMSALAPKPAYITQGMGASKQQALQRISHNAEPSIASRVPDPARVAKRGAGSTHVQAAQVIFPGAECYHSLLSTSPAHQAPQGSVQASMKVRPASLHLICRPPPLWRSG